jgi:enterochelin esterase family protein
MTKVGSIFYLRRTFESDARLDYRFVVNGRRTLDPLNPRTIFSGAGDGDASELVMPAHHIPEEIVVKARVRRGTLHVVQERWATPKVTIYLPASYDPKHEYPTLYTADGSAWIDYIKLPTILDNLISANAIEPIIAVLIDAAADRSAWYHCNPDYLAYLKRVVAYVDGAYGTRAHADERVLAGTSAGGKATAYVGFELPAIFGRVGLLSPSVSPPPSCFEPYLSGRKRPDPHLRVWMGAGTYEEGIHRGTETMAGFFRSIGVPVEARFVHQGHSFGAWREDAVDMLRYFFHRP